MAGGSDAGSGATGGLLKMSGNASASEDAGAGAGTAATGRTSATSITGGGNGASGTTSTAASCTGSGSGTIASIAAVTASITGAVSASSEDSSGLLATAGATSAVTGRSIWESKSSTALISPATISVTTGASESSVTTGAARFETGIESLESRAAGCAMNTGMASSEFSSASESTAVDGIAAEETGATGSGVGETVSEVSETSVSEKVSSGSALFAGACIRAKRNSPYESRPPKPAAAMVTAAASPPVSVSPDWKKVAARNAPAAVTSSVATIAHHPPSLIVLGFRRFISSDSPQPDRCAAFVQRPVVTQDDSAAGPVRCPRPCESKSASG